MTKNATSTATEIWTANRCKVLRSDGIEIATVWAQGRRDEDAFEKAESRARLIAAAPELLEACKSIIKNAPEGWSMKLVEDAIAKATSQS